MSLDAEWHYIYDLTESIEIPEGYLITKIKGSMNIQWLKFGYEQSEIKAKYFHFKALWAFNKLVYGDEKNTIDTSHLLYFHKTYLDIRVHELVDSTKGFYLGVKLEQKDKDESWFRPLIKMTCMRLSDLEDELWGKPNIGMMYVVQNCIENDNNDQFFKNTDGLLTLYNSSSDTYCYFQPDNRFKKAMNRVGIKKYNRKSDLERKVSYKQYLHFELFKDFDQMTDIDKKDRSKMVVYYIHTDAILDKKLFEKCLNLYKY